MSHNSLGAAFTRQATILRKNLLDWDHQLHSKSGEDWPTMLGRLTAATHLTLPIPDVGEHFVYVPLKATANPQDIPFFLSTKVVEPEGMSSSSEEEDDQDPIQRLANFEAAVAQLTKAYPDVRFG